MCVRRLKCVGSSLEIWESMGLSMLDMAEISSKRLKYAANDLDMWEMDCICGKSFKYLRNFWDV